MNAVGINLNLTADSRKGDAVASFAKTIYASACGSYVTLIAISDASVQAEPNNKL
jgi:hypothetical protein